MHGLRGNGTQQGHSRMTTQTGFVPGQTTVGDEARDQQHDHPAELHTHDHYHVTHHHTGGPLGEFEHRASYHTHQHNHAPLVHAHDNEPAQEASEHGKEAHVHDHNEPAGDGR